ncbi:uncharacterized protein LOC108093038 [Drosophila ficusphila]|uniref:uncharacterized protein LOC108093038 n=1 Tax=Drosophila ficusphila TaxID=30025 RepID=UPI001C8949E7|nr:uncharacterized protein LOC108093038 [Drosophila ficusphila]
MCKLLGGISINNQSAGNEPFTCETTMNTSKTGRRQPSAASVFSHSMRQNDASSLLYDIFSFFYTFFALFVLFLCLRRVLCIISRGGATAYWPPAPSPISGELQSGSMWIYKKWTHRRFGCQLKSINRINSSNTMSSAPLKFYLISLLVICAIGWSAGMPRRRLTRWELEERYKKMPPVPDERYGDAELDYAFKQITWPKRPPKLKIRLCSI